MYIIPNSINCNNVFRSTTIARIIGKNAARVESFNSEVKMWVYEEIIHGKKLTDIMNTTHENVKYLPGKKLPENLVNITFSYRCT